MLVNDFSAETVSAAITYAQKRYSGLNRSRGRGVLNRS